jgi:hypothetical protein
MASASFKSIRKRVLRDYKHAIVRSALRGIKSKGRGLVVVKFKNAGRSGIVHISYRPLGALKFLHTNARPEDRDYGAMIIDKISRYAPGSEIPVVITDGETERFLVGIRQFG